MANSFKIFKIGLATGLFLQLAIGPVFFYIINLVLQRSLYDGLMAVLAVTIVDYFYITLSIVGIGKLLENKKTKNIFGFISSIILIIFGVIIIKSILNTGLSTNADIKSVSLLTSFLSVFFLTLSSPMTIVFFTSIFTAKAVEHNYTKKELYIFGFSVGLATFLFMGLSVILFSLLKQSVPITLIKVSNLLVGVVLVGYGATRILKILKPKKEKRHSE